MGLIERKYVDVRESVKLRLQQETVCVSITGDVWTSIATHAYLTLTMHFLVFLNKNMDLKVDSRVE